MKYLKTFGLKLKQLREDRGISQQQLADIINIELNTDMKRNSISNYENGQSYPSIDSIRVICEKLKATSDWLLSLPDDGQPITIVKPINFCPNCGHSLKDFTNSPNQ